MYKLEISWAARNDLADSVLWYNEQQKDLGTQFLEEVFEQLAHITYNPSLFPVRFSGKFRVGRLNRFPFIIVYEIVAESIIINAVFHTSRNPYNSKS